MYVIVEIAGQQFKVEQGRKLFVHYLNAKEGEELTFDKVLLVDNEGSVTVGSPTIDGAKVVATVEKELVKGEKVIVFHKKRRKGYRKRNGHRQYFTQISVKEIIA